MKTSLFALARGGALLAINLLFLVVWAFAGLGKLVSGMPSWFEGKFGKTFLGTFPGLTACFWLLAIIEVLAFMLALIAFARGEFLGRRSPAILAIMLAWSLFIFVLLSFGQWLTADYSSTIQLFTYFGVTLVALHFVLAVPNSTADGRRPGKIA